MQEMAGEEALEAQLKGLSKTFNSVTVTGRANVRFIISYFPVTNDCFC
jgi:hypothetical protein